MYFDFGSKSWHSTLIQFSSYSSDFILHSLSRNYDFLLSVHLQPAGPMASGVRQEERDVHCHWSELVLYLDAGAEGVDGRVAPGDWSSLGRGSSTDN